MTFDAVTTNFVRGDMAAFFGVRWEAQRRTAFFAQFRGPENHTLQKSAVVASLCRRSPKYGLLPGQIPLDIMMRG